MIKAGIVGFPIAHSKSPLIHGHWLAEFGIDGSYEKIELPPENFEDGIRKLMDDGFVGCNATVPHKEAAFEICDHITERGRAIGAINTLVFKDNQITGDNTDCEGFLANLMAGAPEWNAGLGPALVLGAGGAARGIVYALLDAGVPEVIIANRTRARADALAGDFSNAVACDWADAPAALGAVTLLVNTTSLGMTGSAPLELDLQNIRSGTVVTDAVYNPLETQLLKDAKARGCQTVDGLGMLLHQAVPGFEAWFGKRPIVSAELRKKVEASL